VDSCKLTTALSLAHTGHGKEENRTSLITAMIKYGNVEKRLRGYTEEDLQLAHTALSQDLMEIFQYNRPLEHDIRSKKSVD